MEVNMVEEVAENTSGFNIGDVLLAPAYGNLEKPFTGQVEKIYDNALLVEITENDPVDQPTVNEMNHRAVVRMDEVEVIKHAPAPEKKAEEEA
jgi:Asp-tRNA(Asn)/Glu-tRNA(Gln) amidotransferase C subunit